MGYRYDLAHLSSQARHTVMGKEQNSNLLVDRQEYVQKKENNKVYNIALFSKLGLDATGEYNGQESLKIYQDFCDEHKAVWFSTNALAKGIGRNRKQEFLKAISERSSVEIYFAVGKGSDGKNDIVYKGEVLDIRSDKEGIISPDLELTPKVWNNLENKIWIKLKNVKPCNDATACDFTVASTGNKLANVITKSRYHFGYIKRNK